MNFETLFKTYLTSIKPSLQNNSVKNYVADVRKFIAWFEHTQNISFDPKKIDVYTIRAYKQSLSKSAYQANDISAKPVASESIERYLSSLRKFFTFLQEEKYIDQNPLKDLQTIKDPYFLQGFKYNLLGQSASQVTVKNYLLDVQLFLFWLRTTHQSLNPKDLDAIYINDILIEEYKKRMTDEQTAPATINRRLSSLRKYANFLRREYKINNEPIAIKNVPYNNESFEQETSLPAEKPHYSVFPPIRLLQRIFRLVNFFLETLIVIPLVHLVIGGQYMFWILSGKRLFVPPSAISSKFPLYLKSKLDATSWSRRQKIYSPAFYSPFSTTTVAQAETTKYIQIHLNKSKYIFLATSLSICVIIVSVLLWQQHVKEAQAVLGINTSERLLTFKGTLYDAQHLPITQPTQVRFSLYNDGSATNSALIWQTVQTITPHADGSFQTTLGMTDPLPQTIFSENPLLYLGTTIGINPELKPREEIPSVSLSNDTQEFNGMPVVNQNDAIQRNVILALDSSGNLAIGGTSSPTFSATDGTFTLSGTTTLLTTNSRTNGNIVLAPDGLGIIDVQKPLSNTTDSGNFPNDLGAVEVDDRLAIWATSSAQPAVQIDQFSTGDLISASNSGITKFSVNYVGAGTFASDLAVNGGNLTTTSTTFHLLDVSPLELDIGGNANTINIGSTSGTLTINNATTSLGGNLAINGTNGISLNGSGAGISFSGNNNHIVQATQGSLTINNAQLNNPTFSSNVIFNNKVGIGNASPQFRLDVQDSQDSSPVALIKNTSTSPNASVLSLQIGASGNQTNKFINFLDTNGNSLGSIAASASGITLLSPNADFAEYLHKNPQEVIPTGATVCFTQDGSVTQCNQTYSTIAGVVSTNPTILAGKDAGTASVAVGLTGQLQVRVSSQNGPIQPGDPLSVSNIPGVIVKATTSGTIVGHALATYTSPNPYLIGSILVLVQPSWYDPSIQITDAGNLSIQTPAANQAQNEEQFTVFNGQNPITTIAAYSTGVIANLQSGMIQTKNLIVSGSTTFLGTIQAKTVQTSQLSADRFVIAGISLQDYINNLIHQSQLSIANPGSASIQNLSVNIISPVGSSSAVKINGNLTTTGDASVSGQLASNSLQTTDATVSGTLHAHKIIADEIEGLNASPSATYVTNVTNVYQATPSAQLTASSSADPVSADNLADKPIQLAPNNINLASYSALLSDIPDLQIGLLSVTTGLMSTGMTSLGDTSIAGQLSVGGNLMLTQNSISTVGSNLEIQPGRLGGIDFLNGLVAIDTSGNLKVQGNAFFNNNVTVNGTLATNTLSPLANPNQPNNLTVKLSTGSAFMVNNASNSAVVVFNQSGDVSASGSGNFSQLIANGIQIVQSAQADTSITETVATASAGTAVIYHGQTERTIITPFAKATSLIYITPTSDTGGLTPYIARQTDPAVNPGEPNSFTIQIPTPANKNIHLNWWIVN